MKSAEQGDVWHAASLANGGVTCEDAPGFRDSPTGKIYLANLSDPDGNKRCVLHWPPNPT